MGDLAVWSVILAGGTLVFPGEAAGDPPAFAREIVRHGINTLHTTPAFARELAAAGVSLDGLEILHLGGEALPWDTVVRLREAAPRCTLWKNTMVPACSRALTLWFSARAQLSASSVSSW